VGSEMCIRDRFHSFTKFDGNAIPYNRSDDYFIAIFNIQQSDML